MKKTMLNGKISIFSTPVFAVCMGLLAISPLPVLAAPGFAADPGNGQRVYMMNCSGCHGQNGISDMPQAPNLARYEVFTKPDQVLINTIRSGRNMMPAFLGVLNDQQMRDVISYVRTLH
ncbi:MAG: cytochrome c [Pseudomonadota bacterium]